MGSDRIESRVSTWVSGLHASGQIVSRLHDQQLNQRRVLSVSGENPASALLIANLDSHAAVGFPEVSRFEIVMQRRSPRGVNINASYTPFALRRSRDGAERAVRRAVRESRGPELRFRPLRRRTEHVQQTARWDMKRRRWTAPRWAGSHPTGGSRAS